MRSLLLLLIICITSQKAFARGDSAVAVHAQFSLVEPHYYTIAMPSPGDSTRRWRPKPFGRPPYHERLYHPEGSKGTGLLIGGGAVMLAGAAIIIAGVTSSQDKTQRFAQENGALFEALGVVVSAGGFAMVLVGIGVNDRWHNRHRRQTAATHF